ncbi:ADAMTS-like protein 3 [Galemys pyrenaicus]|uniref:ADAMTS-like protein 3 n=1 Tax=Galemys pyrenaicus TaxID=202257 RepID=A0A8J6A9B6_GALPY|nr:ADAMTS-like protein 3 [Galemys pyrenaicus]
MSRATRAHPGPVPSSTITPRGYLGHPSVRLSPPAPHLCESSAPAVRLPRTPLQPPRPVPRAVPCMVGPSCPVRAGPQARTDRWALPSRGASVTVAGAVFGPGGSLDSGPGLGRAAGDPVWRQVRARAGLAAAEDPWDSRNAGASSAQRPPRRVLLLDGRGPGGDAGAPRGMLGALGRPLRGLVFAKSSSFQAWAEKSPGAYFLPEFALSPQGSFLEDATGERLLTYRLDDQTSRNTRSDEEEDVSWDAWGAWSDCSRTCGGGASYSLRRCLAGRDCEGQSIRYRTCSNQDCPPDAGDFRAQQCAAYDDVQYQGRYYEWLPRTDDPARPCALRCYARGLGLVAELAPKVLDGTRCRPGSLDMCISGVCQAVGCDRRLGSRAKEDHCGVCAGDGATCRLVRGQAKAPVSAEKIFESRTLQGGRGEHAFGSPGVFVVENTTVEFQRGPERQAFRIAGPLAADFIFKTRSTAARDSVVQFFFYQPIGHQWRQTDFFPCTATCGGGYQLNSAECVDVRLARVVPDHYCHYYPENVKPQPKLKECGMEPCPASDGFKEVMPYDHFQPLPRWERSPWTVCSASCGGGVQTRGLLCVEESVQGEALRAEEWKCAYAPRPVALQACNLFDCPKWAALDWSQCTVTCGRGLRYRVVLCVSHRGEHVGGCSPPLKPHTKEECVVPVPCHRPREKSPVEAEVPWLKQAQELGEPRAATEDPTFVAEAWSACSATCGPGVQVRAVRCRAGLAFSQAETELPDAACRGPPLPTERPCLLRACDQGPAPGGLDAHQAPAQRGRLRLGAGRLHAVHRHVSGRYARPARRQDALAVCVHAQTQQAVGESRCDPAHRPPAMSRACNTEPCPPRWHAGPWGPCSASCGVGIQSRDVLCLHAGAPPAPSEECGSEKPHALRACNLYACQPRRHVEDWRRVRAAPGRVRGRRARAGRPRPSSPQRSRTCGGGTQRRRVTCRQLLTDGRSLSLPDELCPGPRASPRKSCARTDCPPHLSAGDWSEAVLPIPQCSVSCGVGTQRRKQACQRLTAKGRRVAVSELMCRGLPGPPLVRPCQMPACPGSSCPSVGPSAGVALSRQQAAGPGMPEPPKGPPASAARASPPPVEALCPAGHCGLESWVVPRAPHAAGCDPDAGGAACCRGRQARTDRSVACPPLPPAEAKFEPAPGRGEQGPQILGVQRVYIQTRAEQQVSLTVGSRAYLLPNTSLLVRCPVWRFQKSLIRWEKDGRCLHTSGRLGVTRAGALRIRGLAAADAGTYQCVAGPARASTVLRLIGPSRWLAAAPGLSGGDLGGPHADANSLGAAGQRVRQAWGSQDGPEPDTGRAARPPLRALLGSCRGAVGSSGPGSPGHAQLEAASGQGAHSVDAAQLDQLLGNVSWLLEAGEVSGDQASRLIHQLVADLAQAPPARPAPGGGLGEGPPAARAPQRLHGRDSASPARRPDGPVLRRARQGSSVAFNRTVRARIGGTVYVTGATRVISLLCELASPGEATYAWTKDGAPLRPSRRVRWDGRGEVQLRSPRRVDAGVYGCSVASSLGSDAESSTVLFADRSPAALCAGRWAGRQRPAAVLRAGLPRASPAGVPTPSVTWSRPGGVLGAGAVVLAGGALLLRNVSADDSGSYECTASNALGSASATSALHLLGPFWGRGNWTRCSATCGSSGARVRRPRCVTADGQPVGEALCGHLPKPPAEVRPCRVRDCPSRCVAGAPAGSGWGRPGEGQRGRGLCCVGGWLRGQA